MIKLHDAIGIFAHTQLLSAAEHAERFHPTQLGLLNLEIIGQHRADFCKGRLKTCSGIWSTAHHLEALTAVAHVADSQLVRIRMLLGADNFTHDHTAEDLSRRLSAVDLQSGHGELKQQFVTV